MTVAFVDAHRAEYRVEPICLSCQSSRWMSSGYEPLQANPARRSVWAQRSTASFIWLDDVLQVLCAENMVKEVSILFANIIEHVPARSKAQPSADDQLRRGPVVGAPARSIPGTATGPE